MEIIVESQANVVKIDEGIYPAKLKSIEKRTIRTRDGQEREVFVWTFEVDTKEEIVELQGLTNARVSTGINPSKAYRWLCAILGRQLEVGEKIKVEDLIGRKCIVVVEDRETRFGVVSRVVDVKKAKVKKTAETTTKEKKVKHEDEDLEEEEGEEVEEIVA